MRNPANSRSAAALAVNPYTPPACSGLRERGFRLPFLRFWCGTTCAAALVNSLTCWLVMEGDPEQALVWGAVTGLQALFFAVYFSIPVPVRVGPHGLTCFDIWSRPHFVEWQEISRVDRIRVVNTYLLIRSPALRRTMWLPLVIARRPRFWQLVREYCADGPLIQALQRNVADMDKSPPVAVKPHG
jgi:hypothetical protein